MFRPELETIIGNNEIKESNLNIVNKEWATNLTEKIDQNQNLIDSTFWKTQFNLYHQMMQNIIKQASYLSYSSMGKPYLNAEPYFGSLSPNEYEDMELNMVPPHSIINQLDHNSIKTGFHTLYDVKNLSRGISAKLNSTG